MKLGYYSNRSSKLIKTMLFPVALATIVLFAAVPTFAQEDDIEIVNQDGERVENSRLIEDPLELEKPAGANEGADGLRPKSGRGVLTYTDSDGNEKQVDLDRAQSIVVQQSTQSVNNNGQQETKVVKKAIVVDADGQRHEIDLSKNDVEGLDLPAMPGGMLKGFPNAFGAKQNVKQYTIGVRCAKVAPALQAQLGLAEDSGLVVRAINEGSPAEAAGLQKHDILLFADDQELMTQEDLMRVVQKVGKAGSALSLTVMRGGKEIGVDVSPIERTTEQLRAEGLGGLDFGPLGMGFGDGGLDPFGDGDLDNQMENMRQRMEQMLRQRLRAQQEAGR